MSKQPDCVVIRPPATEPCGAPADHRVTFRDGSRAPACGECALHLQQTALAHATTIAVEKIA